MTFRKATKTDVPAIVALLADDILGAKREDARHPLPDCYMNAFGNIEEDKNQELIVADDEKGMIVGTLQLTFIQYLNYKGGIRALIESVRIHKEFRGKALGSEMIGWAVERSKERGAHIIQLTTDKQRPEAIKFYEKLGFVASHEGFKMHV